MFKGGVEDKALLWFVDHDYYFTFMGFNQLLFMGETLTIV